MTSVDETLAEFDSAFNWANQVKDAELERWRIMYGFVPDDLRNFLKTRLEKVIAAERDAWIAGTRCFYCGNEMESSPTSNTCASCWETL